VCGIADALAVVGDRWALLAIRELSFGVTRFNDIQINTGAPRASLAARLRELADVGLVERHRYSSRPPRDEYVLTPAGRDLGPVLRELRAWGERYASSSGQPPTGHDQGIAG
jgi:DNA-binding HxlR family transcriptional regulator